MNVRSLFTMLTLIVLLTVLGVPVEASVSVERMAGQGPGYVDGPGEDAKFSMASLVLWDKNGKDAYVLDGVSLRYIADGQVKTITSLWQATEQLAPYGLDGEARIWSFRYGNMVWGGDKIYLSGLMFKKDVKGPLTNLTPESSNWTREGFTYNVFFEIDPAAGDIKLLRADKAYCNIAPRNGNYIQGIWDKRPDLTFNGSNALYVYYFFVPVPKIQPMGDSFLVVKSTDPGEEDNNQQFWLAKWNKDGSEEILFNLNKLAHRYHEWDPIPNTKPTSPFGLIDVIAFPGDDTIYLTDGVNSSALNIFTGEVSDWISDRFVQDGVMMKGKMKDGYIYFLDNTGIWTVSPGGATTRPVEAKYLDYSGNIFGYDINSKGEIIVANYTKGTIDMFKLSDLDVVRSHWIYLNNKQVRQTIWGNATLVEEYNGKVYIGIKAITELFTTLSISSNQSTLKMYHNSGRSITISLTRIEHEHNTSYKAELDEFIDAYNSISPLKIEGKYLNDDLYLNTTGTENSHDNNGAPDMMYGIPVYE